jgi:F-type H+-transporting ATPase subunit b
MSENTGTAVQQSAEHSKTFAPLDPHTFPSQLLWLAITFVLLYVLARRVMLPHVGSVIEERRNRIKGDIALAEELKLDTQAALARYTQDLADARSHAGEIARDLRQKVTLEVEKERARIEAEIEARISDAEKRIAMAKAKALVSVGEIASEVATAIVSKLIDEEVTTDEIKSALIRHAAE